MPEIKHNFSAGKMNKDLDERLVPNGQYRSALNIQVRTTDGDSDGVGNAGVAQNIQGTIEIKTSDDASPVYATIGPDGKATKIIGSVAHEKADKAYFFSAAPVEDISRGVSSQYPNAEIVEELIWVDSIIEVDTKLKEATPIFVDRFAVIQTKAQVFGALTPTDGTTTAFTQITVNTNNGAKYRVGMKMYAQDNSTPVATNYLTNGDTNGVEIVDITGDVLTLAAEQNTNLNSATVFKFIYPERVLEFDYNTPLTGINIIDDLLFWTNGKNEPKKINITRSKQGTSNNSSHTQLYVNENSTTDGFIELITDIESVETADIKKEHITVIRKAPTSPPTLFMKKTDRETDTSFSIPDYSFIIEAEENPVPLQGDYRWIEFPEDIDFRINDVFIFTSTDDVLAPVTIRGKIDEIDGNLCKIKLLLIDLDLPIQNPSTWSVELEQPKPLFETKFGRFGYRYRYTDGEYSSFSPWSELAFLPKAFSYTPSKGYNKGMSNDVRQLIVKDFIPDDKIRPSDVNEVDLLWKTSDSPNVYVVKSIKRGLDLEWTDFTDTAIDNTGSLTIKSEMIYKVLPENQLLRAWDNVPKKAAAQEITGSRIVYGNYTQGYGMSSTVGLKQFLLSTPGNFPNPQKSIKTLRNYKFGMVFGDKYGRETPVVTSGHQVAEGETTTGDITIDKEFSTTSNKFKLLQDWDGFSTPKKWMDYVKYYVKETSNEYYNLVLDRWYDAGDGNIWLAFASVDRNKVDEETYLILKTEHGGQSPITEEARYKIIAIENEAPDYIKTDNRDFEPIAFDMAGVYGGSTDGEGALIANDVSQGSPTELIGKTKLLVNTSDWQEANIKRQDFQGTKKARIKGEYTTTNGAVIKAYSPWKTVSRIVDGETKKGVVLTEPFVEVEVNMYQKIVGMVENPDEIDLADVDNEGDEDQILYYLELRDEVIENKPQFDGRFFVKIERDDVLTKRVLNEAQGEYISDGVYEIAYIANMAVNPSWTGSQSGFTWPSSGSVFTNSNIENTSTSTGFDDTQNYPWYMTQDQNYNTIGNVDPSPYPNFGPGDPATTEQFWQWWFDQGIVEEGSFDAAPRTTNIFLDQAPAYKYFNFLALIPYVTNGTLEDITWRSIFKDTSYSAWGANGAEPISYYIDEEDQDTNITTMAGTSNNVGQWGYHPGLWLLNVNAANAAFSAPSISHFGSANFHPPGLSLGDGIDNQYGQMCFSSIGSYDSFESGSDSIFKSKMMTVGTKFRFPAQPGTPVYQVIENQVTNPTQNLPGNNYTDYEFTEGHTPISIQSDNFPDPDGNNPLAKRNSIIVRFQRLDNDGGLILNSGIEVDDWDPRGQVQHNGIGSFQIELLSDVSDGELTDETIATEASCWETEPKKDVGLDIYYEATGAVPMKLNSSNVQQYVGASKNSKHANRFIIDERTDPNDNSVAVPPLSSIPFAYETFNDDVVNVVYLDSNGDVQNLVPAYLDAISEPAYLETTNLVNAPAINDVVSFVRKDGQVTRSKIIDHYKILSYYSDTLRVAVPSDRKSVDVAGGSATNIQDNIEGALLTLGQLNMSNSDSSGISFGDEVSGNGVRPGTFVVNIVNNANGIANITLSKSLAAVYGGTVAYTFIDTTGYYQLDKEVWKYPIDLSWFNCYSFGNGVESDRIRDDFNAPQIDNGVKVSSTFLEYGEEVIGSGMIFSGLYNSTSSINELNQFNMAEKITKNLNPSHGSIQAMKTRDTDVVVFTEDKVLKVLSNKDAVFNADGNPNLTATSKVLGQTIPFVGDYGISKNPESLAWDQYRMYFTDKQRGAVLRLSRDGLTPISNVGMKSYFREKLKECNTILGTFDIVNGEYNVTLELEEQYNLCPTGGCPLITPQNITISFNEGGKGWVSFKSFVPLTGVSVNGKYITANDYRVYEHYDEDADRNTFYDDDFRDSEIEIMFNDNPSIIKSFHAINYEGSQAFVPSYTGADGEYYNLTGKEGWYVDSFSTGLLENGGQQGKVPEFINKENKWFNKIYGEDTTVDNLDESEFSIQGIGFPLDDTTADGTAVPAATNEGTDTGATQTEEEVAVFTLNITSNFLSSWGTYGMMQFIVSGGTAPIEYNIDGPLGFNTNGTIPGNGSSLTLNAASFQDPPPAGGANANLGGPGTYTITMTDANGAQGQLVTVLSADNYPAT